uniref:Uncharacterized protein n=1 Tax=Glossina brevipalpis TaxID=37001 RepID=A0A1A9W5S1_9MUSC
MCLEINKDDEINAFQRDQIEKIISICPKLVSAAAQLDDDHTVASLSSIQACVYYNTMVLMCFNILTYVLNQMKLYADQLPHFIRDNISVDGGDDVSLVTTSSRLQQLS